jgi:hypothetical protein
VSDKPVNLTNFANSRWNRGYVRDSGMMERRRLTGSGAKVPGWLLCEDGGRLLQENLQGIYLQGIKA